MTTIYIGATAYEISLQANNQMQVNRTTGKARPLRISGMASVVQGVEDEEDEERRRVSSRIGHGVGGEGGHEGRVLLQEAQDRRGGAAR